MVTQVATSSEQKPQSTSQADDKAVRDGVSAVEASNDPSSLPARLHAEGNAGKYLLAVAIGGLGVPIQRESI